MNNTIVFGAFFLTIITSLMLFIMVRNTSKKRILEVKEQGFTPDQHAELCKMLKKLSFYIYLIVIMSPVLVVMIVVLIYSHQRHFGFDRYMPAVQSFEHTAFVSGVINNKFYEEIKRLSLSGFHTFVINSPGGDYYAARKIVKTINRNNDKVQVDGGQCASSCVYVFAYSKNHTALYDANFLFHSGYIGWNTPYDRLRRALYSIGIGPKLKITHSLMLSWAAHISPRLKSYLVSCHPDISTTHKGLWLSWEQINFIDKGTYKMSCDAVMQKETSQWRAGIMSNMVYGIKHGDLLYRSPSMPHQTPAILSSAPKDVHTGS